MRYVVSIFILLTGFMFGCLFGRDVIDHPKDKSMRVCRSICENKVERFDYYNGQSECTCKEKR